MFRFDGVDSGSTRRADIVGVVGRTWSESSGGLGRTATVMLASLWCLVGVAPVCLPASLRCLADVALSLIENAALPWNSFWKCGASTPRGVWPIA